MTIPDSLAAIAQADPELLTVEPEPVTAQDLFCFAPTGSLRPVSLWADSLHECRGFLLLWCFLTAARKGVSLAVETLYGPEGSGRYNGWAGNYATDFVDCPTAAALAALAAALSADLPEPAAQKEQKK